MEKNANKIRHVAIATLFSKGQACKGIFWGQYFWGHLLTLLYAYRKMIAAKMVFVRFLESKQKCGKIGSIYSIIRLTY